MILVIDTSSSLSALAVIDGDGKDVMFGSREPIPLSAAVPDPRAIEKVVIATGPGSFTGLRRGASFGLGLAMGLGVPVVPVRTLQLQAARGRGRFAAVSEAGRKRFYLLEPGGQPRLAALDELPKDIKLVGLLASASETQLREHGLKLAERSDVRTLAEAAAELLKSAHEVAYGSVKLEYMQSIGARF